MYRSANQHYQEIFGGKVYKLALDGGFTCPNRDGTLGTGGCIFCAGDGSGAFAQSWEPDVAAQLEKSKARVEGKFKGNRYIAYFQSFTNTYAPVEVLERRFTQAIAPEWIVGLAIGTRPDCLEPEKVALLQRLNRIKPVSVELGLQTIHPESIAYIRRGYANEVYRDRVQALKAAGVEVVTHIILGSVELGLQTIHPESIAYIRRGYANEVYRDRVQALKAAGVEVVTHIILGLPGEDAQLAAETTRYAVEAGTDGVKFHLLHVLKGTDLAREYAAGKVRCLSLEEYGQWLQACLAVEAGTDGVKFHLLHVLKGTDLAREYAAGKVRCLSLEEYGQWLQACLAQVPPHVTVHRITGDGAKATEPRRICLHRPGRRTKSGC